MTRIIPQTALRKRYSDLTKGVQENQVAAKVLITDPSPLVLDFVDAVRAWQDYDNSREDFFPKGIRTKNPSASGKVTDVVVEALRSSGPLTVSGGNSFDVVEREVGSDRTTLSKYADGTNATGSGKGGIDYVAVTCSGDRRLIVGELKSASDTDVFYAFVQALTYLSELSSEAQLRRASKYLLNGLPLQAPLDMHLLLVPEPTTGVEVELVNDVENLATEFKKSLSVHREAKWLGEVVCLSADLQSPATTIKLIWRV